MLPSLYLAKGHQQRFLAGSPWLFNNEIVQDNTSKTLPSGTLVQVLYHEQTIAIGYYNKHSLIAFRTLSLDPHISIDLNFFIHRLQTALALRENFYSQPYYRLIHAEADLLPGLIIDRFANIFVAQVNTYGMENLTSLIIAALQQLFTPTVIYLIRDSAVRTNEGLELLEPLIVGDPTPYIALIENNAKFQINFNSSQKTGWFYDQRDNRQIIADLATGKTIIDYFCYSGGFSIQAALSGAKSVLGIDRSVAAIDNAKNSAQINHVDHICQFIVATAFPDLEQRILNQETFDLVLLDPPAFVKTKKDLAAGIKGYEKLLTKGLQLVAKHGFLLITSCSYHLQLADLKICLAKALSNSSRIGKIIKQLQAGIDHPLHPNVDNSEYLKGFLVKLD